MLCSALLCYAIPVRFQNLHSRIIPSVAGRSALSNATCSAQAVISLEIFGVIVLARSQPQPSLTVCVALRAKNKPSGVTMLVVAVWPCGRRSRLSSCLIHILILVIKTLVVFVVETFHGVLDKLCSLVMVLECQSPSSIIRSYLGVEIQSHGEGSDGVALLVQHLVQPTHQEPHVGLLRRDISEHFQFRQRFPGSAEAH